LNIRFTFYVTAKADGYPPKPFIQRALAVPRNHTPNS
jgi:hypothetical protein